MQRKIIEINEELCNGCGQCVTGCAEGALAIVDGKVKLIADRYCDGLGACLGECPTGALNVIEREADAFDEEAVEAMLAEKKAAEEKPLACGCAGSNVMSLTPCQQANVPTAQAATGASALSHWPIKLRLVPPTAPFLKGARILLASDCVPAAFPAYHRAFLPGRVVLLGCPKFDDAPAYVEKLAAILRANEIKDITVLEMEVPCCSGMSHIALRAAAVAGTKTPVTRVIVARDGRIASREAMTEQAAAFA